MPDQFDVTQFPLWIQIFLVLLTLPSIKAGADMIERFWLARHETTLKQLDTTTTQIEADNDAVKTMGATVDKLLDQYTSRLDKMTEAITENTKAVRAAVEEDRLAQDRNSLVTQKLTDAITGLTVHFQTVEDELASMTRRQIHSIELLEAIQQSLALVKDDLQPLATRNDMATFVSNMTELYDGLDESIYQLRVLLEKRSNTKPIPDLSEESEQGSDSATV